ncbi:translocation/assembly module TamB domain-containing protein [Tamlana agarivorans]|uniref:Translocation/assembly module TamB domain-containing protein n=1 Tax=Pseudotamlana agarivorans TaxID=481183 RepID=A0ACC5U8P8_9FLAO|nr:translocation/assembly module TamB domain-containing protein [Tamlana agarivorans]MBU2950692.1 translocation/assembly module TamB domain-containing protein [Tamlana agarivorans]
MVIRTPWAQNFIKNKALDYVSSKTETKIDIESLFLTFDGDIKITGIYLEDKQKDTLLYSKSLEANIALIPLITGNSIGVDGLDWEGVRAHVWRKDSIQGYNFIFLIDAFASQDTTTVEVETDTTSSSMKFMLRNLDLKDFELSFNDELLGINSSAKFEELILDLKTMDLDAMLFEAPEASITQAKIDVIQTKSKIIDNDTTSSTLPKFLVEKFTLNNVKVHYNSNTVHLDLRTNINNFSAENSIINLATSEIALDDILLTNSTINLDRTEVVSTPSPESSGKFEWPDYDISVKDAQIENNNFSYFVNHSKVQKGIFNADALAFTDLTLIANSLYMTKGGVGLNVEKGQFKEGSGLHLKHLNLQTKLGDKKLSLENLDVALNNDNIIGRLEMQYSELNALMETPENSKIDVLLSKFNFDFNDLFFFQPDLKNNAYLLALSKKTLYGNAKATGYISDIEIPNLNVHWGDLTKISAKGRVKNSTNTDALKFNIPNYTFITQKPDIQRFVAIEDSTINIPSRINLSGSIAGSLKGISTHSKLATDQGFATIEGEFENFDNIKFNTKITVEEYELNKLLNDSTFGTLTTHVEASGQGETINNLDALIKIVINDFTYNNYEISELELDGDIKNGEGDITSDYKDENIDIDLKAHVILDSVAPALSAKLNLKGANLQKLGLTNQDMKTAFVLNFDFKGDATAFNANALLNDGVLVYDNNSFLIGDLKAVAHLQPDTTSVVVENKIINIDLQSNTSPKIFSKALKNHVFSYFYRDSRTSVLDTLKNPVKIKFKAKLANSEVINKALLVNLEDMDTINIDIDFNEKERKLLAYISAPHINYSNNTIDSLSFAMNTDEEKFNFNLGFQEVNAGPLLLPTSTITGIQKNNELHLDLNATYKGEELSDVQAVISGHRDSLNLHVLPEKVLINKEKWTIPSDNAVFYNKDQVTFNNFNISKNNQSIDITNKLPKIQKDHIAATFKNFQLKEIFNYLNPEKPIAKGELNGHFIVQDPLKNPGIVADLNILQLEIKAMNLGTLSLQGKSQGENNYTLESTLSGGDIDLDLQGNYKPQNHGANLDLDINLNKFNMHALEGLTDGEVVETDGYFKGIFKINGTTEAPNYNGTISFNNAKFKISKLNSAFALMDETLKIDNKGIYFTDFTLKDENSNAFDIAGSIGTESYINPTFDLSLNAKNFQVLNATKEDNEILYGKLVFDADAKITGDLEIPKVDLKLTVDSETDVTYIMPTSSAEIESRDGIVRFVNRNEINPILTQTNDQTTTLTGFDISSYLKVGDNATFTIVINEQTNDNFKVYGQGEFDFTMKPNGQMNLAGVYNVSGGHYEMSLYNLVNKHFDLAPESRVTWSGNPFNAAMDIRAVYNVKTSATGLMASAASGVDLSEQARFQQVLPFYVYLNIDGELTAPEISFNLDMPEDEQGAISGQVYGRVQQINQEPDALNKQVFSLLVLNRFYPDSSNDGSEGGFSAIARDNLTSALSDQLNVFSDKLLGNSGFDLDFGLNSYTDYQGDSPEDRTNLDIAAQKKLFHDRLIVKVGSEVEVQGHSDGRESTPLIGNVNLEYLLTKDGRYKLKGFRKNEYENIIEGQTIATGLAIAFTQEFNKYRELWDAMFKASQEEEEEEESDDDDDDDDNDKKVTPSEETRNKD